MHYEPPTPAKLDALKQELGLSSSQMAELFGISTGRAWRRYASEVEANQRDMGMHMLFFAMARLELSAEAIERILARMRQAGATIDLDIAGDSEQ